jgi:DNA-binding PadR family transcriptional regulator
MTRRRVSNPLALAVLSCLSERPMHPYEISTTLRSRGKEQSIKLNYGSLYAVVESLHKHGLIRSRETTREGRRPERTVYEITEEGSARFHAKLRTLLSTPAREFPVFPAALSFLMMVPPDDAARLLSARVETLKERLAESRATMKAVRSKGLPRLFLLEEEYRQATMRAEIDWLSRLIGDLQSKKITWSKEWLKKMARLSESAGE